MTERKNSKNSKSQTPDISREAPEAPEAPEVPTWLSSATAAIGSAPRGSVIDVNGGVEFKITPDLIAPFIEWRKSNPDGNRD